MPAPETLPELTELFRRLGAPDPEAWASSQIEEGIPQLARFLFLRQAWRQVVREGACDWIEQEIERSLNGPDEPFAAVGHALTGLRAKGASGEELTDLVRGMQVQLLHGFCYLLGDPGLDEAEVADMDWSLVQTDDDGNMLGFVDGLHESVLETEPTGREMRPRPYRDGLAVEASTEFDHPAVVELYVEPMGKTMAPALAVLRTGGFEIRRVENRPGFFEARKGRICVAANDPVTLLGLATMVEARGDDWRPTHAEIDAIIELGW